MVDSAGQEVRERIAGILKSIVQEMTSCQSELEVTFTCGEKTTIYNVNLPQQYRGKLIGSQGKNISSLRGLLTAMSGNHGFRAIIELVI